LLQWVASFDGPSAFLATLLILHFCCVLVKCFCYMENKLSLSVIEYRLPFFTYVYYTSVDLNTLNPFLRFVVHLLFLCSCAAVDEIEPDL